MKKLHMILPMALILCFLVGCQDKAAMAEFEAMKTQAEVEEQNKVDMEKLADNVQKAMRNIDYDALVKLYAEDAIIIMPGEPEPIKGREALLAAIENNPVAMPDISYEFTLILISGNHIVFEGFTQGTFTGPLSTPEGDIPPTGKSMKNNFAFILKVNADGLIEEDRTYFDNLSLMQQLGLIK